MKNLYTNYVKIINIEENGLQIVIFNNYFIDYEGYNNILPYSITELSELIGMKKSTISKIQRSLIEKGYLKKQVIIDENGKEKEISRTNI